MMERGPVRVLPFPRSSISWDPVLPKQPRSFYLPILPHKKNFTSVRDAGEDSVSATGIRIAGATGAVFLAWIFTDSAWPAATLLKEGGDSG